MSVNQAHLRIESKFAFLDATGTCHRAVAQAFHRQGHHVYPRDGYRLARYRDSIGGRSNSAFPVW